MAFIRSKISFLAALIAGAGSILNLSGNTNRIVHYPHITCDFNADKANLQGDWNNVLSDMKGSFDKLVKENNHVQKSTTNPAA